MRELEHRFPNEIAVVGVHSGKYVAERVTPRIREAATRLDNAHPIVNDRQFRVWRSYAVRAWPTLVVVDPQGYVVGSHAGEFTADAFAPLLERMIAGYDAAGLLTRAPLDLPLDGSAIAPGVLRYPGKVAVDRAAARIAVADTGHHRVLVGRLSDRGRRMTVDRILGGVVAGGEAGLADGIGESGGAAAARFRSPNGVHFGYAPDESMGGGETTLYVADTGNHCVRAVELRTGAVRTIAGTGRQLRTRRDMDDGALSSPWDVAQVGGTLYVAMAGIHQIWAVDLAAGRARAHSGQFGEDIRDGRHGEALLAQPMGIAADPARGRLWFVDAESSAVRWSDVDPAGGVGTVVGTGLFDFGDVDGVGDAVRMQHQQGLALNPRSGRLLVADSYNDALKWVDPDARRVDSWVRGLHEPGGVAFGAAGVVYVADTNAHRVAVVEETSGMVEELEIVGA